jgi:hypothetical protein
LNCCKPTSLTMPSVMVAPALGQAVPTRALAMGMALVMAVASPVVTALGKAVPMGPGLGMGMATAMVRQTSGEPVAPMMSGMALGLETGKAPATVMAPGTVPVTECRMRTKFCELAQIRRTG